MLQLSCLGLAALLGVALEANGIFMRVFPRAAPNEVADRSCPVPLLEGGSRHCVPMLCIC
jgi:hypothetical protein